MPELEIRKKVVLEFGGQNDAAKAAVRGAADAVSQMQQKAREDAKETATATKQAAREIAAAEKQARREQAEAAKQAAREATQAAKQAAREQAEAAKQAAREAAEAQRRAAMGIGDSFREMMRGASGGAGAIRNLWQGLELASGTMGKFHFALGFAGDVARGAVAAYNFIADAVTNTSNAYENGLAAMDAMHQRLIDQASGASFRAWTRVLRETYWDATMQGDRILFAKQKAASEEYLASQKEALSDIAEAAKRGAARADEQARKEREVAAERKRIEAEAEAKKRAAHDAWKQRQAEIARAEQDAIKAVLDEIRLREALIRKREDERKAALAAARQERMARAALRGAVRDPEELAYPGDGGGSRPGVDRQVGELERLHESWQKLIADVGDYKANLKELGFSTFQSFAQAAGSAWEAVWSGQKEAGDAALELFSGTLLQLAGEMEARAVLALGAALMNPTAANLWTAFAVYQAGAIAFGAGGGLLSSFTDDAAGGGGSSGSGGGYNTSGYESTSTEAQSTTNLTINVGSGFTTEREVKRAISDAIDEAHQKGYLVSKSGAARRRN